MAGATCPHCGMMVTMETQVNKVKDYFDDSYPWTGVTCGSCQGKFAYK